MAVVSRKVSSLLPACLFASLLLSDLIEADEGDDTGLPFLHKTFPVLPAPVPLYLSGGGGGVPGEEFLNHLFLIGFK